MTLIGHITRTCIHDALCANTELDMTIYCTSDIHFDHTNIIKYCNRPYSDVGEMNEAIIANWNSIVMPDDLVLVAGDVCMGNLEHSIKYVKRLSGRKILIKGNHDKKALKFEEFRQQFEAIHDYLEFKDNGDTFIISHYPFATWNGAHRGSMHLHGHSHGSYKPGLPTTLDQGKILDVGMDVHGMCPISFDKIRKIMAKKQFSAADHHGGM
jgi:calcineurin-like phosphoesterase family protein